MGLLGVLKTAGHNLSYLKAIMLNKTSNGIGVTMVKRCPHVIVSLTTYPKRIAKVKIAIDALLNQSLKPDKIVISLAEDEMSDSLDVVEELSKYKGRGLEIRVVEENFRQYNKLIHSLIEFPEDIIITVDDDVLYGKGFIEGLYAVHEHDPGAIVAYRYAFMKKRNGDSMSPYNEWPELNSADVNNENMFFCGVGGVLYPPGALHSEVLNSQLFMSLCPTADDIWFNAMAILKGTRKLLASKKSMQFPSIGNVQQHSLYEINVVQGKNDVQIKNVFDHFRIYDYLK
jgi:glycosyltransferase involved in cell wall biosynthesis